MVKLTPKLAARDLAAEYADLLWLYSMKLSLSPPNWQGFMSKLYKGAFQCTTVLFNPMIPLNPLTNESVYSTMSYVMKQASLAKMCCATLTFDQPLYLKALKIKEDSNPEFNHLFVRLGGFHQLMSFLGSGCKMMEASGLEDVWELAYARNSLPKMMNGKAYSRTLRAVLLTEAALYLTLMKGDSPPNTMHNQQNEDINTDEESLDNDDEDDNNDRDEDNMRSHSGFDDNSHDEGDENLWSELKTVYNDITNGKISLE